MDEVADQVIRDRRIARNNPIKEKGEIQKRAIVIGCLADARQGIVSEDEFNIVPCQRMNGRIIDYQIRIIPK